MFDEWRKKFDAGWQQLSRTADTIHNHLEYETKRKTERTNTFNDQATNATKQLAQNTVSTAKRAYNHRSDVLAIRQAEVTGDKSKFTERQKTLDRPIGSKATRNGKPVLWAGDSYTWQSPGSFKELEDKGHFRQGDVGYRRVQSDISSGIESLLSPDGKAKLGEAVQATTKAYEQYAPPEVKDFVNKAGETFNQVNEATSKTLNISPAITSEALIELGTLGLGKAATVGGRAGLKVVKNADLPSRAFELQRDLRGRGAVPLGTPGSVGAASTLPTPTNWQSRARDLYGNQEHKALADTFRRGQGGKLSKNNTFITADELALNKDGALDQMLERADRMSELRTRWAEQGKEIKGDRQRELYDAASLNPNHKDMEMYSSDAARKYITKFTNVLSGDEWHHVFGNKEAGEFILSMANSDPLVAANLFKKMEALGLNSSGVSKNIAILKKSKHTNWHDFIKATGMEPKSPGKALSIKGSTAPGDFADLSQELGRAIVAGKGDINDAFKLLELYSSYNQWMMKQITSKKFGGKIINELPEGVGKAIQIGGYRTRPPKSKYQALPKL